MFSRLGVLFEGLQLGQGDNVDRRSQGTLPHRLQGRRVIVIEAVGLGVEQLPPLILVSSFPINGDISIELEPYTLAPIGGSQEQ